MCGLAGYISHNSLQSTALIQAMTDIIRHRGPDDEGFIFFADDLCSSRVAGGRDTPPELFQSFLPYAPSAAGIAREEKFRLGLGHRRLSIVDVSAAGHQPMCTPDKRYWIVYNGEVYNHIELRTGLEQLGYTFHSHSDTEVILASYREWGKDCLSRFNGMFAFLLYDVEQKRLFAARDRFGVKPLYYRVSAQGIAFASEIKQFTVLPDWQARMNGQRVYDFLNWSVLDHTDETMFSGVFQLRPGHCMTINVNEWPNRSLADGRLPATAWYQLAARDFSGSFDEAAAEFRRLITDAVSLRLRADVPVGSCLSGGLDSSSIVCVMNELMHKHGVHALQKTFSACSDVSRFDERHWIDEVVNATDVEAHYIYPTLGNLFEESSAITWHQDEPFGSTSIYAQWSVFRLAAENGVKVMLDGQGADEQLAGYHGFFAPRLASLLRGLNWISLINEIAAMRRLHGYSAMQAAKYLARSQLPEPLKNLLRRNFGYAHATPDWLDLEKLGAKPVNPLAESGADGSEDIRAMSIAQLTSSNLQMLLHWEDRNSMAHAIESRVPFLDYRLVEFVVGLPDEYKLAGGVTKRVLRSGMSGILPDVIRDRMDKLGFVTPEEVWVREKAPDLFREKLGTAIRSSQGVLKPEASDVLEAMISGEQSFNFGVWRMVSFGAWIKKYNVCI